MTLNKLIAIFMVAIMTISVVGVAFAGGAVASDDEEESLYDDPVYIDVDTEKEDVSVHLDTEFDVDAGATEVIETDAHAADADAADYDGDIEVSVNEEGDVEVENVDDEEITVTGVNVEFDAAQLPYVLDSEHAEPVDDEFDGDASIVFEDQQSDGERLTVSAAHSEDFAVVFYEVDEDGDPITEEDNESAAVGESADLDAGDYEVINVDLDEELDEDDELAAVLYEDDESVEDTNADVTVDEVVMSDFEALVTGPAEEDPATTEWMAYHADKVVDMDVSVDHGELNESEYEVNETDEDVNVTVDMTRNGTAYEDMDLDNLQLTLGLDENVFQNVEDHTELDSDVLTLDRIEDDEQPKTYVFEVQDVDSLETYTLDMSGEVTAASSDNAIEAGAYVTPDDSPETFTSQSYEIDEGGDAGQFVEGLDEPGTAATGILVFLGIGTVGYAGYKNNVFSRLREKEAEAFGILAAGAIVVVAGAEAMTGSTMIFAPTFDMIGYEAEAWIVALIGLAIAGVTASMTLDKDELPTR